jgi:cAMP phosphodiesterase
MKIEVLGCYGNMTIRCRTTAYLINDKVLFDAGTATAVLSPERLGRISHVCLSHIHLDHVKGLCALAEWRFMSKGKQVTVSADKQVIAALSKQVFNNLLWPDFTAIPDKKKAVVRLKIMGQGYSTIAGLRVKPVPVKHRIHTTGFIVQEKNKTIMMTSDTGLTDQFWQAARSEKHLEFIIAHVAFPSRLLNLALMSGHMTPAMLLERIDTFGLHQVPIYIAHMKSIFELEIRKEIKKAGRQNLRFLKQGSVLYA